MSTKTIKGPFSARWGSCGQEQAEVPKRGGCAPPCPPVADLPGRLQVPFGATGAQIGGTIAAVQRRGGRPTAWSYLRPAQSSPAQPPASRGRSDSGRAILPPSSSLSSHSQLGEGK
jgi:hypothetical protein